MSTAGPARILFVDNDASLLHAAVHFLALAGYRITAARDGQEAWDSLLRDSFDLLITDYEMPRLNGAELVDRLRRHGMALPVIVISGALDFEDLFRHSGWSRVDCLRKPFSAGELVSAIDRAVSHLKRNADPVALEPTGSARSEMLAACHEL